MMLQIDPTQYWEIAELFVKMMVPALFSFAVTWGAMNARMKHVEKQLDEQKAEVKDLRLLREDMAVVKNELKNIHELLERVLFERHK